MKNTSLMMSYLSESDKDDGHASNKDNFFKVQNLLCPSTFIRLYRNDQYENKIIDDKKPNQYKTFNKSFKEDNSLTSD